MNPAVFAMGLLRILSGTVEIFAGLLMWRLNAVDKALLVNSSLALVGPLILLTTTAIGLVGLADRLLPAKAVWIGAGVACIFIGIKMK